MANYFERKMYKWPGAASMPLPWSDNTIWDPRVYFYLEIEHILVEHLFGGLIFIRKGLTYAKMHAPRYGHYPFEMILLKWNKAPGRSKVFVVGRHCDRAKIDKYISRMYRRHEKS